MTKAVNAQIGHPLGSHEHPLGSHEHPLGSPEHEQSARGASAASSLRSVFSYIG